MQESRKSGFVPHAGQQSTFGNHYVGNWIGLQTQSESQVKTTINTCQHVPFVPMAAIQHTWR